jgi:hypothetical protein
MSFTKKHKQAFIDHLRSNGYAVEIREIHNWGADGFLPHVSATHETINILIDQWVKQEGLLGKRVRLDMYIEKQLTDTPLTVIKWRGLR